MDWRCEYWYISGIHTGWRIVRGSGLNLEIDSGFAYDWQKPGDYEEKLKAADKRLMEINA